MYKILFAMIKLNHKTITEILRFGITGVLATAIHYLVYYLLMLVLNTSLAFTLGYLLSFVFNYFMSAKFTFRKKASAKNGLGFCCAHIFNYTLQISLLNVFLWFGISKELAPVPVYCISIPVNFLFVRFVFDKFSCKD